MDIERKQNESLLDYHRRLVYGKLVDKTLSDMDYTELAELIYGQPYSSDVARRMLYGSRRTLELMDSERVSGIADNCILSELDEKMIELRKERQKFYDQRREFNKAVSASGRIEHLHDTISKAAEQLGESVGTLEFCRKTNFSDILDNEAVLVFGDWHYGMVTHNTFNQYDTEICKVRVMRVVEKAVKRLELHKCRRLHIVVLGDLFHGAIHTSARVASEELVCGQIMEVSEILAQAINELSQSVAETFVYMTYGNHGRTVPNKNDSIHRDNLERVIPWWLTQRLRDNDSVNIAEDTGTEFLFINAAGHELCASHGDLDSVKSSPRLLSTLFFKRFGKDIEYILLGDKHHRESFEELGVTAIICGALCGSDDYANGKRLYSTPSQMLLIVSPKDGIDAEYRITCD